jgi:serine/threonine protein kinase
MSDAFNPYHRWLGIPLQEQPPHHYRLLGLQAFEQDPDVIETAADHRAASLRLYVDGKRGAEARTLLKEVADARRCLLVPDRKQAYDAWLHEQLKTQAQSDVGSQLGEYLLEEKLGQGGMGVVYRARHLKLGRMVAVKILAKGRVEDPQAIARFEREIAAIGCVSHPNIVQALDARETGGTRFLVMEYIEGLHLGEILRRCGPLLLADAAHLVYQTALGLQAAHLHGLVHRDIKPSNLMLTATGLVKVLDLGLARFVDQGQAGDEVTASGQAMGTIDYMAPEQVADSRRVDIRADIYGLGCTFYKLLTNQAPFGSGDYANTLDKLLARVQNDARPVEELREVPPRLAALIARMLARDPDDRFATPAELAQVLLPWTQGSNLPGLLTRAQRINPVLLPPDRPSPGRAQRVPPSSSTWSRNSLEVFRAAWKVWAKTALVAAGVLLFFGLVIPFFAGPPRQVPAEKPETRRPAPADPPPPPTSAPTGDASPSTSHAPSAAPDANEAKPALPRPEAERPGKPAPAPANPPSAAPKPASADPRPASVPQSQEPAASKSTPVPKPIAAAAKPPLDSLQADEQSLLRLAAEAKSGPQIRTLVESAQPLLERAMAADAYEMALRIATESYRVCSASGGKEYRKAAAERRTQVQQLCDRWQQFRAAEIALIKTPDDGNAQLTVGRWLCFTKGDWPAGLAHLARGSDAELRQLAERDLRHPAEVGDQLELGDAWWGRALAAPLDDRKPLLLRAAYWYRLAEPKASTGLAKIKIQKRLDDLPRLTSGSGSP